MSGAIKKSTAPKKATPAKAAKDAAPCKAEKHLMDLLKKQQDQIANVQSKINGYIGRIEELEKDLSLSSPTVSGLPKPDGYRPAILGRELTPYEITGTIDANHNGVEEFGEAMEKAMARGQRHESERIVMIPYWNFPTPKNEDGSNTD